MEAKARAIEAQERWCPLCERASHTYMHCRVRKRILKQQLQAERNAAEEAAVQGQPPNQQPLEGGIQAQAPLQPGGGGGGGIQAHHSRGPTNRSTAWVLRRQQKRLAQAQQQQGIQQMPSPDQPLIQQQAMAMEIQPHQQPMAMAMQLYNQQMHQSVAVPYEYLPPAPMQPLVAEPVYIDMAPGAPTRLHLGRISYETTVGDIHGFFRGYGRVVDLVMKRGYAFVELENERDAEDAVRDLNGRHLNEMPVTLNYAQVPKYTWNVNQRSSSPPQHSSYRASSSSAAHHHDSASSSRARSPRAAAWYGDYTKVREHQQPVALATGAGTTRGGYERGEGGSSRAVRERDRDWDEEVRRGRERARQSYSGAKAAAGHYSAGASGRYRPQSATTVLRRPAPASRSRSPIRPSNYRNRLSSPTNSQSSSVAIKRERLPLEEMDEYEDEDNGTAAGGNAEESTFFKLLDHRTELEAIARELSLDINIRPFDSSVAFGGIIPATGGTRVVKDEPSTSGLKKDSDGREKWMVFADKGPLVQVSSYEDSVPSKEHSVPKFAWDVFSGAIRGMCEKFLLGK